MGELPPQNGSICAGAEEDAVVGADLGAGDAATMSCAYMGHFAFHVVPHLQQLVIATWQEREENILIT